GRNRPGRSKQRAPADPGGTGQGAARSTPMLTRAAPARAQQAAPLHRPAWPGWGQGLASTQLGTDVGRPLVSTWWIGGIGERSEEYGRARGTYGRSHQSVRDGRRGEDSLQRGRQRRRRGDAARRGAGR